MGLLRISVAAGLAVVLAAALGPTGASAQAPSKAAPAKDSRELVAVLDLEAIGSTAVQASAMTDQLRVELLKTGKIALVDRAQMDNILKEQALQQTGCTSSECAVQVGKVLGVRKLVTGRITKIDTEQWLLAANLIDVQTAETLRSETLPFEGAYFALLTKGIPQLAAALVGAEAAAVAGTPTVAPASARRQYAPGWTKIGNLTIAREAAGVAVLGNTLFVLGGWTSKTDFANVDALDLPSGRTSSKPPLSSPRRWATAQALNGKVYIFGGWSKGNALDIVEFLDPNSNSWLPRKAMPTSRSAPASAVTGSKIVVIGGFGGFTKQPRQETEAYDSDTDTWTARADMPTARVAPCAAGVDGRVYVISGHGKGQKELIPVTEAYNPSSNSWSRKADTPFRHYSWDGCAALNGKIYVVGGWDGQGRNNTVWEYDPKQDSWRRMPDLRLSRSGAAVATGDGAILTAGGWESISGRLITDIEAYVPN